MASETPQPAELRREWGKIGIFILVLVAFNVWLLHPAWKSNAPPRAPTPGQGRDTPGPSPELPEAGSPAAPEPPASPPHPPPTPPRDRHPGGLSRLGFQELQLGLLVLADSREHPLRPAQAAEIRTMLAQMEPVSARMVEALARAEALLTRRQRDYLLHHREPPDFDELEADPRNPGLDPLAARVLKILEGRRGRPAEPATSDAEFRTEPPLLRSPEDLLIAVLRLHSEGSERLTPRQLAALAPLVKQILEGREEEQAFRSRMGEILTPEQVQLLVSRRSELERRQRLVLLRALSRVLEQKLQHR